MQPTLSRRSFIALAAALSLGACGMLSGPPEGLDLARAKPSTGGKYAVAIAPTAPLSVGALHTWTIELHTADGAPVHAAKLAVDGGMPQHGHGLPTRPRVTENLGDGKFLLEGMKFNMPGWWTLDVQVDGPSGADTARFNIVL